MNSLTGLLVDVRALPAATRHEQLVCAVAEALLAAGYTIDDGDADSDDDDDDRERLAVRIGLDVDGCALVTDGTIVTFAEDVAATAAAQLGVPAALFCVRDYGYRRGRRDERAAFVSIGDRSWVRAPRRSDRVDDVWRAVSQLGLWPSAEAVLTRPGTTLFVVAADRSSSSGAQRFPPRDDVERQRAARHETARAALLNLRAQHQHQIPDAAPYQTLVSWAPAPLPDNAEAVAAFVTDAGVRDEAWVHLVIGDVNGGNLVWDARTASFLWTLCRRPPTTPTRHPSNAPLERAVVALCATELEGAPLELDDEALLAASVIALPTVLARARERLLQVAVSVVDTGPAHRAAHAAALLALFRPAELARAAIRAAHDDAFVGRVGVHFHVPLVLEQPVPMLALFDVVQPYARDDRALAWTHAHTLWLTGHARARGHVDDDAARRRIDLALRLAPDDSAVLNNAIVLAAAIGDAERVRAASTSLRKHDPRHPALRLARG